MLDTLNISTLRFWRIDGAFGHAGSTHQNNATMDKVRCADTDRFDVLNNVT